MEPWLWIGTNIWLILNQIWTRSRGIDFTFVFGFPETRRSHTGILHVLEEIRI